MKQFEAGTTEIEIDGLNYRVEVHYDPDCENPFEFYDSMPQIAYLNSSRHMLGTLPVTPCEMDNIRSRIMTGEYIGFPAFAQVHSGISMSIRPFSCTWDSGQSGYVYAPADVVLKDWFGRKRWSAKLKEKAKESIRDRFGLFAQYMSGECYYVKITPPANVGELESVGSIIGMDNVQAVAEDILNSFTSYAAKESAEREYWKNRGVVTVAQVQL